MNKDNKLDSCQQKAFDLIKDNPNKNFFIQGEAGTGKSYLINYIKQNLLRKYAVIAPSGTAAELIGGATIHSLFHLGGRDFFPEKVINEYKDYDQVVPLIETLIIDEASMLRADIFDTMNVLCQKAKNNKEPFGGIQIILVGDLRQLSPVYAYDNENKTDEQFKYITETYSNKCPFFFDAKCYEESNFEVIKLEINHRQDNDQDFLKNLKQLGQGIEIEKTLEYFNTCKCYDDYKYIEIPKITAIKATAKKINDNQLEKLEGPITQYKVQNNGYCENIDEKEDKLPVPVLLELKPGAKVMFCKNDPDGKYVNGTIGYVEKLNEDSVKVLISDPKSKEFKFVTVGRATWKKEEYERIEGTDSFQLVEKGSFSQIPLKLAYAMTIHKSQGQTWDRVCLDLVGQNVFAEGQLYVALSRVKTKEGIYLTRNLREEDIKINRRVNEFLKDPTKIPESDMVNKNNIVLEEDNGPNKELRNMLKNTGCRDIYKDNTHTRQKLIDCLKKKYNLKIVTKRFTGMSGEPYQNDVDRLFISKDLDWWICLYDKNNEILRLYYKPDKTEVFGITDFNQPIPGKFRIKIEKDEKGYSIIKKDGSKRNIEEFFKLECNLREEDLEGEIPFNNIDSQSDEQTIDNISSINNMDTEIQEEVIKENNSDENIKLSVATWLERETSLSYPQIAEFLNLPEETIQKIADKKISVDPINAKEIGIICDEEIRRCEQDKSARIMTYEELYQKYKNITISISSDTRNQQSELVKKIEICNRQVENTTKENNDNNLTLPYKPIKEYFINNKECTLQEFERYLQNKHVTVNVSVIYRNGNKEEKKWVVNNFSEKSNLSNNLHSGYLRNWKERGIKGIRLEIKDVFR